MTTVVEYLTKKKLDEKQDEERRRNESTEILDEISGLLDAFQIEDIKTLNRIFALYKKFVLNKVFVSFKYKTSFWNNSKEIYTNINGHLISTDYDYKNPPFSYIVIDALRWDVSIFGFVFKGRIPALILGFDKVSENV